MSNESLTSLAGLESLSSFDGVFILVGNVNLRNCATKSTCGLIERNLLNEENTMIFANGEGCASLEEIITACEALPVKLVKFTTHMEDKALTLEWQTSEEVDSHYFEIQTSTDSQNWSTQGIVASKDHGIGLHNYQFQMTMQASGVHYFRLRMVDNDGSYELSPV